MRTFVRRRVYRGEPGKISFGVEDQTVVVEFGPAALCRRCRKAFGQEPPMPVITAIQIAPHPMARMFSYLRHQCRTHYKVGLYHGWCVPPAVFHAAAGSRPAPGRSRVVPADAAVSPPRAARRGVSGSTMTAVASQERPKP